MRFSRFLPICGALSVLLFLCGCSYLLPDNPSAPRYNSVTGERRRPALNNGVPPQSAITAPAPPVAAANPIAPSVAAVQTAPVPVVNAAPLAPVVAANAASAFPPVDAETQARAAEIIRRAPAANPADAIAVAGNFPPLSSVPPRPVNTGEESAEARLAKVREQLERDRANAAIARDTLARDAADAPSILRDGKAPAAAPITVKPLAPEPQVNAAPVPPAVIAGPGGYIALPPTPLFAPPPPPVDAIALRSPVSPLVSVPPAAPVNLASAAPPTSFYAPASPAGLEPIVLRPPVGANALVVSNPGAAPASLSGFDPLAVAPLSSATTPVNFANSSYLPESRYQQRR